MSKTKIGHILIKLTSLFRFLKSKNDAKSAFSYDYYKNSGFTELELGNLNVALSFLQKAIELNSEDGVVVCLLGITAARLGKNDALDYAVKACKSEKIIKDALNVGSWFLDASRLGKDYRLSNSPNWDAFQKFANLTTTHYVKNKSDLFILSKHVYHRRYLKLAAFFLKSYIDKYEENSEIFRMLVDTQFALCDLDHHEEFVRKLIDMTLDDICSNTDCRIDPYNLLSLGVDYDLYIKACFLRSNQILKDQSISVLKNVKNSSLKSTDKRVKIGFLLPYSWFTSLTMVLDSLLPYFNREKYCLYGYSMQSIEDFNEFQTAFISKFDVWSSVPIENPRKSAECIRSDDIDILIDTSGHTRVNCLPIMAHRPAKVQIHYLGYSNAICAPFIDYLVADEQLIPEEIQVICPDNLALMPLTVMTYPKAKFSDERMCRADIELDENSFYFCSFNYLTKIEPKIFSAWLKILSSVESSKLVLCHWNQPESVENLRYHAERSGIAAERICFLPPIDHQSHLKRLGLMDLALDTLYMGGGVTSVDCLWAGLPFLTVKPDFLMPHNGRDYLNAVGIRELVTSNLIDYVSQAIFLAKSPDRLAEYRTRLVAARDNSLIFDSSKYCENFENLLSTIWNKYVADDPPASFCVLGSGFGLS